MPKRQARGVRKAKFRTIRAFACVGSHGGVYCTDVSPHDATIGRYQIYSTREIAEMNAFTKDEVREVIVREIGKVPKHAK